MAETEEYCNPVSRSWEMGVGFIKECMAGTDWPEIHWIKAP